MCSQFTLKKMANEKENLDSEIEEKDLEVSDDDDVDALKEKFQKVSDANRQLFARAKKAEGFELKDGKWIKPEVPKEPKEKVEPKPDKEPSKPNELDYGQKAFLKSYQISGSDELALVKQFQDRGFDLDAIVGDDVFTSKLANLREARASADAVPKDRKRSGQSAVTDVDIAVAKYKETGELPEDFETRKQVVNKMVESEKAKNKFSGPAFYQ